MLTQYLQDLVFGCVFLLVPLVLRSGADRFELGLCTIARSTGDVRRNTIFAPIFIFSTSGDGHSTFTGWTGTLWIKCEVTGRRSGASYESIVTRGCLSCWLTTISRPLSNSTPAGSVG